ncbi:hypothetical protein N1851_022183 [Merluccius polli]|uniref:Uncharacterized protein n=1 Tax=Merluccius polli TaxID=89951 RepID=A0AA47MI85_MERPO|nr:hypothetical protein N1851_022183 [Merluccius polli]
MDLLVTVEDAVVGPSPTARNLGVILDDQLRCTADITAMIRSCRFALYNIRRGNKSRRGNRARYNTGSDPSSRGKQRSPWSKHSSSSRLDYCNSLLAGLPASKIKPLQPIQNAAARLVFNLPKFNHVTPPIFRDLHWLPVAARITFKTMVLTYKAVNGTAPDPPPGTSQTPRPG